MTRLSLTLTPEEKAALFRLAERERRDPRDQAALIVRRALERLGLLPAASQMTLSETNERKEMQHA